MQSCLWTAPPASQQSYGALNKSTLAVIAVVKCFVADVMVTSVFGTANGF